ncbi:MAG: hypothetical protein M0R77_18875 [Gammaproteobacteria bacterium]|nr:hypothetical protein [Gammaproteobacteria bacterium]
MTALDRWEKEFSFRLSIDRSPENDQYDRFKDELNQHRIPYMMMGSQLGFKSSEDLAAATLLY